MPDTLLEIKDLHVTVEGEGREATLLDHIDLAVPPLSITALVGGSGSGKTTTGLSILRLLPPGLSVKSGTVRFDGRDLLGLAPEAMHKVRGGEIAMVFQEPLFAFNPVFTVGAQIDEVLAVHTTLNRQERRRRVLELLGTVGLPDAARAAANYPHQLSGGMRQRAMIAQAIAAGPKLIIADEPTSNLDVTLQARIIELFRDLKDRFDLSVLLITHDLGMVGHVADRVAVMTQGRVVEHGATKDVLDNPQHGYTKELMEALA